MGREVRRVPADWQHPKYPADHYPPQRAGQFIALYEGGAYDDRAREWDEGFAKWREGFVESYGSGERWVQRGEEHVGRYTEWAGERPSPDDYMPDWPAEEATHLMMYEDTSEGTPISPAFDTPHKLARWLADNNASAFGSSTASYEDWLSMCERGWAPSAIVSDGKIISGVSAMSTTGDA